MRVRASAGLLALALLLAATGCGGGGGAADPQAAAASEPAGAVTSTTTSSSVARTPEEEVEAAYLRSWDVYAKAMAELRTDGLDEAFAEDALMLRVGEVQRLRDAGTPARMRVEHGIHAVRVDGGTATVLDAYTNHSVLIDPQTRQPTEPDPNSHVRRAYTLKKVGGTWKVVLVQDDSSSAA